MPEPTVNDAIRLLTDPQNRAMGGALNSMVRMRAAAIVGELEARSGNLDTARALVAEAVLGLGGTSRVQRVRSIDGHLHERDDIWVPLKALREPPDPEAA